jgi:hypothetical protein
MSTAVKKPTDVRSLYHDKMVGTVQPSLGVAMNQGGNHAQNTGKAAYNDTTGALMRQGKGAGRRKAKVETTPTGRYLRQQ